MYANKQRQAAYEAEIAAFEIECAAKRAAGEAKLDASIRKTLRPIIEKMLEMDEGSTVNLSVEFIPCAFHVILSENCKPILEDYNRLAAEIANELASIHGFLIQETQIHLQYFGDEPQIMSLWQRA